MSPRDGWLGGRDLGGFPTGMVIDTLTADELSWLADIVEHADVTNAQVLSAAITLGLIQLLVPREVVQ